ncbi:hypothetical protein HG535_0D05780 [Zygotorulaspora mrakii]|uniref:Uncharacterized protein n=1 Tax=Zygotorulaspora mrakii TaxID=42260 RepID=A0A7H9B4H0_ZYGMR|nr:uncharacterized protein HG535_0D05780 [Zygotorulaspora mrakii]QLG72869.1 hypothetical protein HG535_0D05780 [Zygotorulaspora mrakii]
MNNSKKRSLTLTPSSNPGSTADKKRTLDGSPHRHDRSKENSMDWQKQCIIQENELARLKKLNEYLKLERECNIK